MIYIGLKTSFVSGEIGSGYLNYSSNISGDLSENTFKGEI